MFVCAFVSVKRERERKREKKERELGCINSKDESFYVYIYTRDSYIKHNNITVNVRIQLFNKFVVEKQIIPGIYLLERAKPAYHRHTFFFEKKMVRFLQ